MLSTLSIASSDSLSGEKDSRSVVNAGRGTITLIISAVSRMLIIREGRAMASKVDCLVSKGWENIPTIELRGDRVHLIFDEPFDVERYDVLQEECLQELHDVASQSEEEGTEAVEEIVVLETQKKEENSGISEEDFDEYIAGLEDYGEGGKFVPIPLKLDDFKPFTESGNCLSDEIGRAHV